jgi:hypothetical protein
MICVSMAFFVAGMRFPSPLRPLPTLGAFPVRPLACLGRFLLRLGQRLAALVWVQRLGHDVSHKYRLVILGAGLSRRQDSGSQFIVAYSRKK